MFGFVMQFQMLIFYCTISRNHHQSDQKNLLSIRSCQTQCGRWKFSRILIFTCKLVFYHPKHTIFWWYFPLCNSLILCIFEKTLARYPTTFQFVCQYCQVKIVFHEKVARSGGNSIAQVLFLEITIILWYVAGILSPYFPFHQLEY